MEKLYMESAFKQYLNESVQKTVLRLANYFREKEETDNQTKTAKEAAK